MDVPTDTYDNFKAIVSYHATNTFYNNIYTLVIDSKDMNLDNLDDKYKAKAKNYIDLVNEGRHTILQNLMNLHVKYIKINYDFNSYVKLFVNYIRGPANKVDDETQFCAKFLSRMYEKILIHIINTGVHKITSVRNQKYFPELDNVSKNLFEEAKKEINISHVNSDNKLEYIRSLEKRLNEIRAQYTGLSQKYETLLARYNELVHKQESQKQNSSYFEQSHRKNEQIPEFYTRSHDKSEDEEYQAFVQQEKSKQNATNFVKPSNAGELKPMEVDDFFTSDI
jgi:hypothetical protein